MSPREFKNEFSWSKSRHGKFAECLRLYWFHYYGAWGGWAWDAPPEIRERYILKNLSTRQQWAGKVVHDTIATALGRVREGAMPTFEELRDEAHARMRREFAESRVGRYRDDPKRRPGLVEHALRLELPDAEWRANWENAERCLSHFASSEWLDRARRLTPEAWLPIDVIDAFPLEGIKVFAGPDFAFREGERIVMVDWKTGSPRESDHDQVKGYALFAESKWGVPAEAVEARLVYLPGPSEERIATDSGALETFREEFRSSVRAMKQRLRNPETNEASEGDFPMTEACERCAFCPFQQLCGRGESR